MIRVSLYLSYNGPCTCLCEASAYVCVCEYGAGALRKLSRADVHNIVTNLTVVDQV